MKKTGKEKAEEQFNALQKKAKKALAEKEKKELERKEHIASLRTRRLAKEAADKLNAEVAAMAKNAGKKKKKA